MTAASGEVKSTGVEPPGVVSRYVVSPVSGQFDTFAAAMHAVDVDVNRVSLGAAVHEAPAVRSPGPLVPALARHLDRLARDRVKAQALSDDLAGAWAHGTDLPALAVKMHRHARAMASYNMSVMWSAKLVGLTTSALKQLTSPA
ncbi:MAG: hypothetical protein KGQ57_04935 [Burkholderiales bacterium]|nr:hypothetical protein [Burkholderiales bacterium]